MRSPSSANGRSQQAAGTTDNHPAAKDASILQRHVGKDKREEGAGERVEEERGEQQGNGGQRSLIGGEARANADTPHEKRNTGEAEQEEQKNAQPMLIGQNSLAGEAQSDGGGEPDQKAKENEFRFHNMNMNSYST
jgi:hypothetical protein